MEIEVETLDGWMGLISNLAKMDRMIRKIFFNDFLNCFYVLSDTGYVFLFYPKKEHIEPSRDIINKRFKGWGVINAKIPMIKK